MYAPGVFASDEFATGEVAGFSNAHYHIVRSVGNLSSVSFMLMHFDDKSRDFLSLDGTISRAPS